VTVSLSIDVIRPPLIQAAVMPNPCGSNHLAHSIAFCRRSAALGFRPGLTVKDTHGAKRREPSIGRIQCQGIAAFWRLANSALLRIVAEDAAVSS
jgi:hypothetical protein